MTLTIVSITSPLHSHVTAHQGRKGRKVREREEETHEEEKHLPMHFQQSVLDTPGSIASNGFSEGQTREREWGLTKRKGRNCMAK